MRKKAPLLLLSTLFVLAMLLLPGTSCLADDTPVGKDQFSYKLPKICYDKINDATVHGCCMRLKYRVEHQCHSNYDHVCIDKLEREFKECLHHGGE